MNLSAMIADGTVSIEYKAEDDTVWVKNVGKGDIKIPFEEISDFCKACLVVGGYEEDTDDA